MRASERLHVAQPALSVHLANLEAELGVKLVNRSNRGIELTDEGRILFDRATVLLQYHNETIDALRTREAGLAGSVSIGVPSTLSSRIAPPLYQAIRAEFPNVSLYLLEANTPVLYDWLQTGKIDFAVLFSVPEHVGLVVTPMFMEDFFLVGPSDGNLSPDIAFRDIFDYLFVLPRRSSPWRKVLDKAAEDMGKSFSCAFETESMSAMLAIATTCECYTILPKSAISHLFLEGGRHARRIVDPSIRGPLSISSLGCNELSIMHRAVRDMIVRITSNFGDVGNGDLRKFYSPQVLPSSPFARSPAGIPASAPTSVDFRQLVADYDPPDKVPAA